MSKLTAKKSRNLQTTLRLMDIPATGKPNQGEEIFHFSHPQHPLVQVNMPYLFTCMGCKEYGAGRRYRCQMCGFDLHEFCAMAPPSLYNHPFHQKHQLVFFTKQGKILHIHMHTWSNENIREMIEGLLLHFGWRRFRVCCISTTLLSYIYLFMKHIGGFARSKCNICSKPAKGYAFRCTACSFEMHPCCATMRGEMEFPTHPHPLILSPAIENMDGETSFRCQICRRKRSGQVYKCKTCGYHIHAICAKDLVNGLYVHGITSPEKSSMLGAAARLAAHAIFGIIGGLIEGIGEGIGEALIENIGRGRSKNIKHK